MPNYRVVWEIDVEADDPHDAAHQALQIMRDPDSTATVFAVTDDNGNCVDVDLLDVGPAAASSE